MFGKFARTVVMVKDYYVDSKLRCMCNFGTVRYAAVNGYYQGPVFLCKIVYGNHGKSVRIIANGKPVRHVYAHGAQAVVQDGRCSYPVHISVSENQDLLLFLLGLKDPVDGILHRIERKGAVLKTHVAFHEVKDVLSVRYSPACKYACNQRLHPVLRNQGGHGFP